MGIYTDEAPKFKQLTDPSKNWVQDILTFNNYEDYATYTKDFKYEATEFMSLLITAVLQKLIYEKQQTTKYEIEDNVEVNFITSFYLETIKIQYIDKRSDSRELQYCCVKDHPYNIPPKIHKEGNPACEDRIEIETHTVLNKPIYHETKIYQKQHEDHPNRWIFDFDKTHEKFLEAFILFANVIDVEHEQMVWLMLKEAEKKIKLKEFKNHFVKSTELGYGVHVPRLPTRLTPRTIS